MHHKDQAQLGHKGVAKRDLEKPSIHLWPQQKMAVDWDTWRKWLVGLEGRKTPPQRE